MKKLILVAILALFVTACNTVKGVGQDVQKGGEALEKSAN